MQLSRKHDWKARVQAYDDHIELTRQAAIEEYEREQAKNLVEGQKQIQARILAAERRFLDRVEQMLEAEPFFTQELVEVNEDGSPRVILNRYPAKWPYTTLVQCFRVLDDSPSKRALDQIAEEHEWGQSREEIERDLGEWLELAERRGREERKNGRAPA